MEVGLITKRSDDVKMICSMEELMNFVHQHNWLRGLWYPFTTYEMNKISSIHVSCIII